MDSDFNVWIIDIFNQPLELQYENHDENQIIISYLKSLSISL